MTQTGTLTPEQTKQEFVFTFADMNGKPAKLDAAFSLKKVTLTGSNDPVELSSSDFEKSAESVKVHLEQILLPGTYRLEMSLVDANKKVQTLSSSSDFRVVTKMHFTGLNFEVTNSKTPSEQVTQTQKRHFDYKKGATLSLKGQ